MDSKRSVKMEDPNPNSSYSDRYNSVSGLENNYSAAGENGSLGFLELLGVQDFPPSVVDLLQESSEVLNTPATPNFSSISSESSGAGAGGPNNKEAADEDDDGEEEEEKQKTKKQQLKPKKTGQKRQREQRFAFMTKSEVDHLEDGYRWRKYGQKAVKNSPFPRSYYRCTYASCNVKKRIERSLNDPTIVMTTYEGQHTHPSPLASRANSGFYAAAAATGGAAGFQPPETTTSSAIGDQVYCNYPMPLMNFGFVGSANLVNCAVTSQQKRFCSATTPSSLIADYGLLQDIVPSLVRKEEQYD